MLEVSVNISLSIYDEKQFRQAARARALSDGLDSESADAYLDDDAMSIDQCALMLIDPGKSPDGAWIV
ncbi:MAG: hypothetical protein C9356_11910 [Oleiphilus sp.]|nr:MAG: hypothetical protein C9356_11910 [Oleiphilus sp.]